MWKFQEFHNLSKSISHIIDLKALKRIHVYISMKLSTFAEDFRATF